MQASKNITERVVRNTPEATEGVVSINFRISPELCLRIENAVWERRCTKRALWIAAMEAYLGKATEPAGVSSDAYSVGEVR